MRNDFRSIITKNLIYEIKKYDLLNFYLMYTMQIQLDPLIG